MRKFLLILMVMLPFAVWAQYAPSRNGSDAIHCDSPTIVGWATSCVVERGPQQITNPSLGTASYGVDNDGTGKADNMLVSLGDGGNAVVTFASPICNEEGPDFAVFENAFESAQEPGMHFLELAFVEVSSDGINYFRIPSLTEVPYDTQIGGFGCIDPSLLHNFAGRDDTYYGTPFDLDDLEDNPLLDKMSITHVRMVDVVGCINPEYATYDSEGHTVNDPWPTPFASSGFDLDAVAVIHDLAHYDGMNDYHHVTVSIYPNPTSNVLCVKADGLKSVEIFDLVGQRVVSETSSEFSISQLSQGVYFVRVTAGEQQFVQKIIKK